MKVLAVAYNTAREAVRDRILYLILFFALALIGASKVLSLLSVGSAEKILVDVGLGSISFFSVLIAIFMGISLVSREIERRTIYAVVSKPISREAFVLGKFVGMLSVMALNVAIMVSFFAATLWIWGAPFQGAYLLAVVLSLLEAALVLALALLFSAIASPLLAAMFTIAAYAVGHWLDGLRLLARRLPDGAARITIEAVRRVFPNLEILNLKDQVVFPDEATQAALASRFGWGLAYGCCYTVAVLAIAALAYRRKDFV